jgi:hydroxymethylglutaryl-CoA reductase
MSNTKEIGLKNSATSVIENFRNLSPSERISHISKITHLSNYELSNLSEPNCLPLNTANVMIENVIGKIEIPLGIATNFRVNLKDYLIPMAIEEPSVVAAASNMAKVIRSSGGFTASSDEPIMRAQIQILNVAESAKVKLSQKKIQTQIIKLANSKDKTLIKLGGGCKAVEVHSFNDTKVGPMIVLHLLVDVRDAMGANTINTMAETVSPLIEKITGGSVRLRILSNLADKRLATASVKIPFSKLGYHHFAGEEVANGIVEACALAEVDPYRAATHNKGIMNGIDSVVLATGNDWRAIEAGAHAWAARGGRYSSLTNWEIDGFGCLLGSIEIPIAVGLVGGATATHPTSKSCINLLGVRSSCEFGQVLAAVGLAQNLGALRALVTEGIQRGHMALHAKNIAIASGAKGPEIDIISQRIVDEKDITLNRAISLLSEKKLQMIEAK